MLQSDVECAWLVGDEFAKAVAAAGCHDKDVVCLPDVAAAKTRLDATPLRGKTILIKGSNGTRLFELPERL